VSLAGQPPRRLLLGDFGEDKISFDQLQRIASWVYQEGSDTEVRHTFLSAELAREWPQNIPFCEGLSKRLGPAFESANLLYKAHLRAASKDTLKALSDLRKTLAEEVQKLLQQSRDLSNGVWRDVAIAVGAGSIRIAMFGVRGPTNNVGFAVIFGVIAIYIYVSYSMAISTNKKFLNIVEDTRKAWRTKLYAFLDNDDYRSLAEQPLADALAAYDSAKRRASIVVWAVIFCLLAGIVVELGWLDVSDLVTRILSFFVSQFGSIYDHIASKICD
jgi:hypothetical protein